METVTTHNDNSDSKERQQLSKQARVISTRNVIPNNRPVTREDVNKFVERRKELIASDKTEEIQAPIAELPKEQPAESWTPQKPIDGTYEEVTQEEKDKIDSDYQQQVTGIPSEPIIVEATEPEIIEKKPGRKKKDAE